jgi:hypothetical protein
MQTKTTPGFHLTPVRTGIIKNTNNTNAGHNVRGKGTLIHHWWECKWYSYCGNQYGGSSKKLKMDLPFNPAIPLLGMCLKECKAAYKRDTYTPMLMTALFTIAKLWDWPRCPKTN